MISFDHQAVPIETRNHKASVTVILISFTFDFFITKVNQLVGFGVVGINIVTKSLVPIAFSNVLMLSEVINQTE